MTRADLVVYNGSIWSLDPVLPHPDALLIRAGRIVEAGSQALVQAAAHPGYHVLDLQGRTALPGLCDAHIHLLWTAQVADQVDLEGAESLEEALNRVRTHVATLPADGWVLGHGWDHSLWNDQWPSATDLDAATAGRPAFLTRKDLHSAWCNTAALQRLNITDQTPHPAGGRIGHTSAGQPNGLLFEAALNLVREQLPQPDARDKERALERLMPRLLAAGITSVHVPEGPDCFAAVQALYSRGKLGVRVLHHLQRDVLDAAIELGLYSGLGDAWVRVGALKLFSDGSLGSQTAWMHEPYAGAAPGAAPNRGMALFEPAELQQLVTRSIKHHISVIVHAIGDAANTMVLDAIEYAYQQRQHDLLLEPAHAWQTFPPHLALLPHRIEHAQILLEQDLRRFAELGIVASVQPIHATSDMDMADQFWGQRCRTAYAWRSLLDAGVVLACGSDAPVDSWNPWWGIHAAVTRQRRAEGSRCWYAEQRISLQEALWGYTVGPAIASGELTSKGTLAPGKLADLVVLKDDLASCAAEQLHAVEVDLTMVEGDVVWEAH